VLFYNRVTNSEEEGEKTMKMARNGGTEGPEKGDFIKIPDDLL